MVNQMGKNITQNERILNIEYVNFNRNDITGFVSEQKIGKIFFPNNYIRN